MPLAAAAVASPRRPRYGQSWCCSRWMRPRPPHRSAGTGTPIRQRGRAGHHRQRTECTEKCQVGLASVFVGLRHPSPVQHSQQLDRHAGLRTVNHGSPTCSSRSTSSMDDAEAGSPSYGKPAAAAASLIRPIMSSTVLLGERRCCSRRSRPSSHSRPSSPTTPAEAAWPAAAEPTTVRQSGSIVCRETCRPPHKRDVS